MDSVTRLQSGFSSLVMGQPQRPNITWNEERTMINVWGIQISILRLRQGCHDLRRAVIRKALGLCRTGPAPDSYTFPDTMFVDAGSGRSLIDHECLRQYRGAKNPIIKAWAADLGSGGGKGWNRSVMLHLINLISDFTSDLAVLVNLTSSAPVRSTDFLDATISDGLSPPSIQRIHGQFLIHYNHSKNRTHAAAGQWAASYVARAVQPVFSWAMTILRGAEVMLYTDFYGLTKTAETCLKYMWVCNGERLTEEQFSGHQSTLTGHYWGAAVGVRNHRQLASALCNMYIPKREKLAGIENSSSANKMLGHTDQTSELHYARLSDQSTQTLMEYQQHCHDYSRIVMPTPQYPAPLPIYGFHSQANEARHFVEGVKACTTEDRQTEIMDMKILRAVEIATVSIHASTQQFIKEQHALTLRTVLDALDAHMPHNPLNPPAVQGARSHVQEETALDHLRSILRDPLATFRPGQELLHRDLSSTIPRHVIAALPCGSGKSLTFLLPAAGYESKSLALLMLPFNSLISEFIQLAQLMGIKCYAWTRDRPDITTIDHGIIFATPECLEGGQLLAYVQPISYCTSVANCARELDS
jgi:hypothetical protein